MNPERGMISVWAMASPSAVKHKDKITTDEPTLIAQQLASIQL